MKRTCSLCLVLIILLLSGCGRHPDFWESAESGEVSAMPDTLGESGSISYPVVKSRVNILVDQAGYRPGGRKVAIFCGETGQAQFRVIDSKTENVVFTGRIEEKGMDQASGEYISYGIFTELDVEGTYYVEADGIGRSFPFEIGKEVYGEVFQKLYGALVQSSNRWNVEQNGYVLVNLLTAYELYQPVCVYTLAGNQEESQAEELPVLLSFVKTQMEKLLNGQMEDGSVGGNQIRDRASASMLFAGAAGQFARVYKEYDAAFAARCQKAAESAWRFAEREDAGTDESYFAAAQLFRLTGNAKYHKVITDYLNQEERPEPGSLDMAIYGDVTYLMTEKKVDVELCRSLMAERMNEVEGIAEQSHRSLYQIAGESASEAENTFGEVGKMLQQMVKLAVIDYVITNHEYATVMENHLHYLLGRNPQAVSYLNGLGDSFQTDSRQDILRSPERSAQLLFMMSAVINHEMDGQQ